MKRETRVRLLMFGMSSYPGGIENYIRNIFFCREYSEKVKIDFLTYEPNLAYSDEMKTYEYDIVHVPHLKKHPWGYFNAVLQTIKNRNYDMVYINMLCAANFLPVCIAKANNVPHIIIHAHSDSTIKGYIRGLLHRLGKRYCDKNATLRLACSQAAAEWLFNKKNKTSPIMIIPNAIDPDKYIFSVEERDKIRKQYGISDEELILGSVGRFGEEKNNLFMLDILSSILKQGVSARLILVGDGVFREKIVKKIKELNIEKEVIMTGTIIEPSQYYSAFDCFLFPSTFEGFGISALEAQACGLTCFCSDSISRELDVTKTIQYIPLSYGADYWANKIIHSKSNLEPAKMNQRVRESAYNIANQRNRVLELIYEKEFASTSSYDAPK